VEYFANGVEDFALYLPNDLIPTRRVLLLRFKNRFETLVQSLLMGGVNCTSAYPITWVRKEWNLQEERMAKEVDVVYFHEAHTVGEWRERLKDREKDVVVACHDEKVALEAKAQGYKDVFYAKKSDTEGLTTAVLQAVDFCKERSRGSAKK